MAIDTWKPAARSRSGGVILLKILAVVFLGETITDFVCGRLPPLRPGMIGVVDTALLIVLVLPGIYLLIVRALASRIDFLEDEGKDARRRAQALASIIETSPECVVITETSGVIRYVNPSWERTNGWRAEEVVGKVTPRILKSGRTGAEEYRRLWRTISQGASVRHEFCNRRKDGSLYEAESIITPLKDKAGTVTGYAALERDITARKRAEKTLREDEENQRLAAEATRMGMWFRDLAGGKTVWTPILRELLGVGPDREASYETFLACVHPEDRAAVDRGIMRGLSERKPFTAEYRCVRPDGSVRWLSTNGKAFYDEKGRAVRTMGVIFDITERKAAAEALSRTEAQLRQSQKMEGIGRLAGGIAHDFNNLLTAISGYTFFLLSGAGEGDPRRADLLEIQKAGERAASLTRQLLAFSRRQILQPKVLALDAVVLDLEKMLRRMIGEDIRLVVHLDPKAGRIKADAGQLGQVVMNLAVNARDAMPDGGSLTIATANAEISGDDGSRLGLPAGRYVVLTMGDTGCGMDESVRANIFEPFFTTKEQGKGTGLGLATVYGIVKQSGGAIDVDSGPGTGTRFHIYLPRVADETPAAGEVRAARPPAGGEETVLLVEDDDMVRGFVRHLLDQNGYAVLEASGPSEALRLSEEFQAPIHLMLTDIVMPEMRGDELAGILGARRPDMRIVFMSGYTESGVVRLGLSDEAFLQKPLDPNGLLLKVRAMLDKGREALHGEHTGR